MENLLLQPNNSVQEPLQCIRPVAKADPCGNILSKLRSKNNTHQSQIRKKKKISHYHRFEPISKEKKREREKLLHLLVNHEDHRHDMLEGGGVRVEMRPQVHLQVLAHLQNHHPLQGYRLPPTLDGQLRLVYLLHQLRIERLLLHRHRPLGRGDLRQPVALDLLQGNGSAREVGGGAALGGRCRSLAGDRVLRHPVAPEIEPAGAQHSRHR